MRLQIPLAGGPLTLQNGWSLEAEKTGRQPVPSGCTVAPLARRVRNAGLSRSRDQHDPSTDARGREQLQPHLPVRHRGGPLAAGARYPFPLREAAGRSRRKPRGCPRGVTRQDPGHGESADGRRGSWLPRRAMSWASPSRPRLRTRRATGTGRATPPSGRGASRTCGGACRSDPRPSGSRRRCSMFHPLPSLQSGLARSGTCVSRPPTRRPPSASPLSAARLQPGHPGGRDGSSWASTRSSDRTGG